MQLLLLSITNINVAYLTLRCPGFFYTSDVQRGGVKFSPHVYLEFCGIYEKNTNSYSHVFEVKLFNGANSYIAGSRVQPEIDMESDKQEIIVSRATGQLGK